MWVVFAFLSALFAGLTAILAKIGIKNMDSNVATALRTVVVLIFSWIMVFVVGAQEGILHLSGRSLLFLILSGLATGASWLCYFKALNLGDVNKVTPIDKSSTVLTMLLAFVFLHEETGPLKWIAMALIGGGTYLMIQKKEPSPKTDANHANDSTLARGVRRTGLETGNRWLFYAIGSAVFASLTAILGKVGIQDVNSTLGTAIRTIVVLIMAWLVVFVTNKQGTIHQVDRRNWIYLTLSGIATGGSWLCYYHALQSGPASVVVPIDKLSILVTIAFAYCFLGEKLTKKGGFGLVLIVAGTGLLLL